MSDILDPLLAGNWSAADVDAAVQEIVRLRAENKKLAADTRIAAERIAAQSELLTQKAKATEPCEPL